MYLEILLVPKHTILLHSSKVQTVLFAVMVIVSRILEQLQVI